MCLSDPAGDPRPRRAVETLLSLGYRVEALSLVDTSPLGIPRYHRIPSPVGGGLAALARKARTFIGLIVARVIPNDALRGYILQTRFGTWSLHAQLSETPYDLIVVEDAQLLPVAFSVRGAARVVFDAREFYPRQDEGRFWFDLIQSPEHAWVCRTYMPHCDEIVTVSPGLAAEYQRVFGVTSTVVRSVPVGHDLQVRLPTHDVIRIVHHGIANRNRKLHRLVDILTALDDRFTLDLYLTGNPTYIAELKAYAADHPRVRFLAPVPFEQICTMLNRYDIGMLFYGDENFNQTHCLPNKLFEYIQARLAVAISPSPDMAAVVAEYGCGMVAANFDPASIVPALNSLTPERLIAMKHGSDSAAKVLRWEVESEKLKEIL